MRSRKPSASGPGSRATSRSKMVLAVALVSLAAVVASTGGASALFQPAPADPQLFDLELAQGELAAIQAQVSALQEEIKVELDAISEISIEMDFLDMNGPVRAQALREARAEARNMAVAAYVGIGPPMSGVDLLDAETASDLSWRNALLRQQADRLNSAAQTYALLVDEADDTVIELNDNVNSATRRVEALNRELSGVTQQMPKAEWYVEIAEIHRWADREFEQHNRGEPSAAQWQALRFCESTETYDIDTGNTFYGAYQFTWETWGTVGGQDNPAHAHPAEQDARARVLYATRGHQPWPICGRHVRYPANDN